jgi:hypothetical protein
MSEIRFGNQMRDGKRSTGGRIIMLKNSKAFSGFAAPDIAKEKKFYSQTLGLKTVEGQWPAHIASGRRQ